MAKLNKSDGKKKWPGAQVSEGNSHSECVYHAHPAWMSLSRIQATECPVMRHAVRANNFTNPLNAANAARVCAGGGLGGRCRPGAGGESAELESLNTDTVVQFRDDSQILFVSGEWVEIDECTKD